MTASTGLLLALVSAGVPASAAWSVDDPPAPTVTLELRIYLLESSVSPGLTTTLSDVEVREIVEEVNRIWMPAGIRWEATAPTRAEAPNGELFERILAGALPRRPGLLELVVPRDHVSDGWDVFFVRELGGGAGGAYLASLTAVVQAEIGPNGRRDDTGETARILAHELGHALGLPHAPCTREGNLMAPGCSFGDPARLTGGQIERARWQAEIGHPHR